MSDSADVMLYSSTAFLMADWAQTRYIRDSDYHTEDNILLNNHPELIDVYFPAVIAGNYFIGKQLNPFQRNIFWAAMTALEAFVIYDNHQIGIRYEF